MRSKLVAAQYLIGSVDELVAAHSPERRQCDLIEVETVLSSAGCRTSPKMRLRRCRPLPRWCWSVPSHRSRFSGTGNIRVLLPKALQH
ncbi:hypothetical protein C7T36_00685 [Rhodococcus sp. AD45-ID]|nr:hypothetical protein C7T36_00685 [Rhodococcus sp. AD45-ID]